MVLPKIHTPVDSMPQRENLGGPVTSQPTAGATFEPHRTVQALGTQTLGE